jgi:hypothetical protein
VRFPSALDDNVLSLFEVGVGTKEEDVLRLNAASAAASRAERGVDAPISTSDGLVSESVVDATGDEGSPESDGGRVFSNNGSSASF